MPPCRSNPLLKAFAMVTVVSGEIPYKSEVYKIVMLLYVVNGFQQI